MVIIWLFDEIVAVLFDFLNEKYLFSYTMRKILLGFWGTFILVEFPKTENHDIRSNCHVENERFQIFGENWFCNMNLNNS